MTLFSLLRVIHVPKSWGAIVAFSPDAEQSQRLNPPFVKRWRPGTPAIVELTNYRKDGTPFRNAVMLAPVLDAEGSVSMFVGSQMDVGAAGAGSGLRQTRARELVARLTPRLRQTLELMAMGYRNKQIGGFLGIEEKTVKMHRSRLIEALGVNTLGGRDQDCGRGRYRT